MKKKIYFLFLFFASIGCVSAQQQKVTNPAHIKKAQLFSFEDIKPLLALVYPGRDFTNCRINNFMLSGNTTETRDEGVVAISFTEASSCGSVTEKQRLLIEKYGKQGMVFMLDGISLTQLGKPGTPYNPSEQVSFSLPAVLFTVEE